MDYGNDYPSVNGLYSDIPNKRIFVFSHLDLAFKDFGLNKLDNALVDNSVDEIKEELEQKHEILRMKVKQVDSFGNSNESCNKKMRSKVSSRLATTSKDVRTENSNMRGSGQ